MAPSPLALVIGALNLDLIASGLPRFAAPGTQVNGRSIALSAGGKGHNIAKMLAAWLAPGHVCMVSKLVQDPYGLFEVPLRSLADSHIRADGVLIDQDRPDDLLTMAWILNTDAHERVIYYFPGRNESLSVKELESIKSLFEQAGKNEGILVLTLEMPIPTAAHAIKMAAEIGLRVILDPGGQPPEEDVDFSPLFQHPIFLLKPNAGEATRLTGLPVRDYPSARNAANQLLVNNVSHLLITHGGEGGYAFTAGAGWHIPAPNLPVPPYAEPTGCGDQVLGVLCAEMLHGKSFEDACRAAILAGSLQYIQQGREPILPNHPGFNAGE